MLRSRSWDCQKISGSRSPRRSRGWMHMSWPRTPTPIGIEYLALRRQDCCRRGSGWWDPCGCPRSGSSCDSSHQGPAGRPQRFRWLKHNMKNSRLGSLIRYRKKKEERTCQTFPPCKTCTSQAGLVSAGPPMTYRHYRYPIHKCNMCPDTYNPFQYETHINMSGAV